MSGENVTLHPVQEAGYDPSVLQHPLMCKLLIPKLTVYHTGAAPSFINNLEMTPFYLLLRV